MEKAPTTLNRAVFLDRDGVLNEDNPNYAFDLDTFKILPGVPEALAELKAARYLLIVVTNQAGISRGLYTVAQMKYCHDHLQQHSDFAIDHFYYSPYHKSVTQSLLTKPGTLMFEKAIAKFNIDVTKSWMVGDRGRDILPARKLGIRTIQIGDEVETENRANFTVSSLLEAATLLIGKK